MMRITGYRLRTNPKLQLARLCCRNADDAFAGPESVMSRGKPLDEHGRFDVNRHAAAPFSAEGERV
jgi:hypothetical protein